MSSRHAYLILAHKNFSQLEKLISLLDDPRNDIYVHVDRRARFDKSRFENLCEHSSLFFIEKPQKVHWGGVSIMRAELQLLQAASGKGYSYHHLLSGMCLPIKDQDTIHNFFDAHQGKEFINMYRIKKTTSSRYNYFTLFPEGAGMFLTNLANNIFKGIQMGLGIKINKDVNFYFASQWFSITDNLASYVLSRKDWLEKVFKHTNTCDEIFLPTLVFDSPFKDKLYCSEEVSDNINEGNMRFIDWARRTSVRHPYTLRTEDYDLLMSVPHFWARKFDENVDAQIIEMIYNTLKK